MPRYYCDYCDICLTHNYLSARKQHNKGFRHKANVRSYYLQFEARLNQTLIDQKIKEHIGQAGVFQQYGAAPAYNQMRHHIAPFLIPMMHGFRPPMFPTPVPGYVSGPGVPPMMAPPGGGGPPHFPSQSSSCHGVHQTMSTLTSVPGIASVPTGGGGGGSTHSMDNFVTYQLNIANATRSGGFDGGEQASETTRCR